MASEAPVEQQQTPSTFDPILATASDLQQLLQDGRLSSVDIVDVYLQQITKHNHYLKAVLATVPRSILQATAEALDKERQDGKVRSPLHGIPILLKVNILGPASDLYVRSHICRTTL